MIFNQYADFYDTFYKDKNYFKESEYIHGIIQDFHPYTHKILELGSGTGNHAIPLNTLGYHMHGLEMSDRMIQQANKKKGSKKLTFSQGDIRDFTITETFDVALSLFHVINYQTSLDDLRAVFANVKRHVKKDGYFIFESWFGPAVLHQMPETRIKRFHTDEVAITRIVEPTIEVDKNLVHMQYQLYVHNIKSSKITTIEECHTLRYLFVNEIEWLCDEFNFKLAAYFPFMTREKVNENTWSVLFIIKT